MSELPKYLEELCEVKLSPKEIETASDAFVQACNSESAAKIEHKNTMDAIKEIKEGAFLLMTKKRESRLVRCLADWNYPVSGRVTLTRTDTHETIERKMTTEEVAPFLPMAKKDEPKPEEAAPAAEDPSDPTDLVAHETPFDAPQADLSLTGDTQEPPQLLLGHDPAIIIEAEVIDQAKPDQLTKAREIFAKHGRSISALQRHLGISFTQACDLRDLLDAEVAEGTPDERFEEYGHIEELQPNGDIHFIHLLFDGKTLCFADLKGARRGATCTWAPDEDEFSKICRTCLAADQRRKFNRQEYAERDTAKLGAIEEPEATTVLCDKCGHWHDASLAICPKCVGKLDADQVKARDFAAGWAVRFREAGCASIPPPWRASDESEDFDHLYRYDHSTTAFCGHEASDEERAKYKTEPGFPPDHYACPVCISKGHRIVDKEIEALKPAKKAKAPKAPKAEKAETKASISLVTNGVPQSIDIDDAVDIAIKTGGRDMSACVVKLRSLLARDATELELANLYSAYKAANLPQEDSIVSPTVPEAQETQPETQEET